MPPTSPKETSESEFYLEKDENYEVIKKNLLIPTNRPTLGYAMNPRNSASQTDLMRWYETTQSLQSLQSQTREVIAENTCLRRKLKSVRDNYELLLHNLRLMNPAEPFLKYRDDIRNFNNNNL